MLAISALYDLYHCEDCDRKFLIESEAEVGDVCCPYCGQDYPAEWKNAFELALGIPMIPPEAAG